MSPRGFEGRVTTIGNNWRQEFVNFLGFVFISPRFVVASFRFHYRCWVVSWRLLRYLKLFCFLFMVQKLLSQNALCLCSAYIYTLPLIWIVYQKCYCLFSESPFALFPDGSSDWMFCLQSRDRSFVAFSLFLGLVDRWAQRTICTRKLCGDRYRCSSSAGRQLTPSLPPCH